ncbi:MAG: signal peptidase I [Pseudomonadota bacterium]
MANKAKSAGGGFLELIKTLIYALILAGLIRTLLFQPFYIPSGSMKDTLLIGDFLFVNKFAYGYSQYSCPGYRDFNICAPFAGDGGGRIWAGDPKRGDVVVFRHPTTGQDYIKRLIGLPGDTVEMRGGRVVLNGAELPQTPDGTFTEQFLQQGPARSLPRCLGDRAVPLGGNCDKQRFSETLPDGTSYSVLNATDSVGDNRGPFTVPEGNYFFIGDNRDNSADSRFAPSANGVGFVPFENLIGRADRIIFSSSGASILFFWTWRADRYFHPIR